VNSPLPLELGSFEGFPLDADNQLEWTTLTEIRTNHFEVERSVNGFDYSSIGIVNSVGNSTSSVDYKFVDNSVKERTYYYRLKMVDRDGSFEYSGIIVINRTNRTDDIIKFVYPNPFNDQINIILNGSSNSGVTVQLFDLRGKLVIEELYNTNKFTQSLSINSSLLRNGVYLLKIIDGEKSYVRKLTKK